MPTEVEGADDQAVALPAFLQEAMRAGVREVLTTPAHTVDGANSAEIRQAIERQQTRLAALRAWPDSRVTGAGASLQLPAPVVAFVAAKGGSGSTILATHWAWALAQKGLRVGVLDLGLRQGNAAMHLSDKVPAFTWSDAAMQTDRIDGAWLWGLMLECQSNLRILPAPALALTDNDAWAHISLDLVQQCTYALRTQVDVLVLDVGTQWGSLVPWVLQSAQSIALIAQPSLPHLHHAQQWLQAMRDLGVDLHQVQGILNASYRQPPIEFDEFQQAGAQVKWRCIPRSENTLAQAVHQGVAMGQYQPGDAMARALSGWADEWWQSQHPHSSQPNVVVKQAWRPWWNRWCFRASPAVMTQSTVSAS
jgi:Flp pilus assembly CpaE family ATPase